MNTETTGLDQEGNLDFDLDLDETLFESRLPKSRAKSEGHLNKDTITPQGKDYEKLPRRYRQAYSQDTHKQNQSEGSSKVPTIERQHRSYGDMPIHHSSRRTSTTSDHSDFSSDFQPSEGTRSQNSSTLFKSVRFDIDDSVADSGVVTGASTPHYPERRASEPEFKATRHEERRASAPGCTTSESTSDEGSGSALSNGVNKTEERGSGSTEDHESAPSDDLREEDKVRRQNLGGGEEGSRTEEVKRTNDSDIASPTPELETVAPSNDGADRTTSHDSPQHQEPEMPAYVAVLEPQPTVPQERVKIAHLIEHWRDTVTEPSTSQAQKGAPKPVKGVGHKVTEIMQRFQQQPVVTTEPNQKTADHHEGTLERRSKQVSKLVTDTTKLLLEPPVHPKEKEETKPQKLNIQWPKVEEVETQESPLSSTSSVLTASVPKLDLTKAKTMTPRDKRDQEITSDSQRELAMETAGPMASDSTGELQETDDHVEGDPYLDEDSPTEENVPWFEQLPTIPVFTSPFARNYQPSHMKSAHSEQLSNFWSFTGQPQPSSADTKQPLLKDDSDSSSEDEDMLEPLPPTVVGHASISPIGKTLFSRSLVSPKARFPGMSDSVKRQPMGFGSEPFVRSLPQHRKAKRLSAIPEESPEVTRSARSSTANVEAGSALK